MNLFWKTSSWYSAPYSPRFFRRFQLVICSASVSSSLWLSFSWYSAANPFVTASETDGAAGGMLSGSFHPVSRFLYLSRLVVGTSLGDIETFVIVLLGICSAIAVIERAAEAIAKVFSPAKEFEERLSAQERISREQQKLIEQSMAGQRVQSKCILQMTTHMIDGNHTEQLREARDSLEQWLIER